MSQLVTQSVSTALVTYLTLDEVGVEDLIFSDVTCQYRKFGQASFTSKTLTALNFAEIGSGVYTITFTTAELNTVGSFTWKVVGAGIDQFIGLANIVTAENVATTPVELDVCVLTGQVFDLNGAPVVGAAVSAKILSMPSIVSGVVLTDGLSTTKTDSSGTFYLALVIGAQVDITIPKANYRRSLTIPQETSADLFTLA